MDSPLTDDWLVLPAMAEPHAHLDKALSADLVSNPAADLGGAIAAWEGADEARLPESVIARATDALERLLVNGVTAVRTHVNCSGDRGSDAVAALIEVRSTFADLVDLQIAALPSSPVTGAGGAANRTALESAVAAGADVVGGVPHLDPDGAGATSYLLGVAAAAGLAVDLHTDETLDPGVTLLADGRVFVKGVPDVGKTLGEIAVFANGMPGFSMPAGIAPGLDATGYFTPERSTYANGAHVAEVEVDRETGGVVDMSL